MCDIFRVDKSAVACCDGEISMEGDHVTLSEM
jgi:hypothetical protein